MFRSNKEGKLSIFTFTQLFIFPMCCTLTVYIYNNIVQKLQIKLNQIGLKVYK